MARISVLIPVYNVERYLRQCLDSLIDQTFKDLEFICINDGSTDSSLNILDEYAQRHSRFRIIDKPNSGYGASMNCGLKEATGEYIGILESDDFAEPDMFEILFNAVESVQTDVVKADNYRCKDGYSRSYYKNYPSCQYGAKLIPKENPELFKRQSIWTALYKRDFLYNEGIYFNETPGASYQDISFNFKVMAKAREVFLIDKAIVNYRIDNPNSSIHSHDKAMAIFDEFEEIRRYLEERCTKDAELNRIMSATEFYMCMGEYNRIGEEHRKSFLERLRNDTTQAERLNYVNKEYWRKSDWAEKEELMSDIEKYENRKAEETYSRKEAIKSFKDKLGCFGHIYIYGAGKVGDHVYDILASIDLKAEGFLVTELKENETTKRGISVKEFDECLFSQGDSICLIAVKNDDIDGILRYVRAKGVKDAICMDSGFRNSFG